MIVSFGLDTATPDFCFGRAIVSLWVLHRDSSVKFLVAAIVFMPPGFYKTSVLEESIPVDSLAATCGSRAALIKWGTSFFEQRDEVVKLYCSACEADQGPEGAPLTFRAYAYCIKHETSEGKNCPVRWRVYGVAGIGSGGTMHINRCGEMCPAGLAVVTQHAETLRIVRKRQVGERIRLKATGVKTPQRSLAHLYEEAGDDGEKPALILPIESLRGQQKKCRTQVESRRVDHLLQGSTSRILWDRVVSSIPFEKEKWKVAQPFELFSVTFEEVDAPPICLLVCKAFLQYIKSWKNTRASGAVCCDTTWKLNVAEWGLFTFAGMATHFVQKDGHRRCMALPFSMTFGPKEYIPTLLHWAIKGTFAFYEKYGGVNMKHFINVVMWEDTTLAEAALHKEGGALAGVDYARNLSRQLSNAQEIAPTKCQGDPETKGEAAWMVIGSISFSSVNLWTGALFHDHWDYVIARLIVMDQTDLVKWVQEHVLFWNRKTRKWDAHWYTALGSKRRPGESTYLHEVLKSLHDMIKDALPQKSHIQDPSTAISKLSLALEAVAQSRAWIAPATGQNSSQKWVFTENLEGQIKKDTYILGDFSVRHVCGPGRKTEHLLTEDDEQWKKPTLNDLAQHLPDNCKSVSVNFPGVKELYVVPLYKANLAITDEMVAATKQLLSPDNQKNKKAFEAAKETMGITISDDGTQRYSLSGSRLFFNNICPVFVQIDNCIVCGCRDGQVYGECGHECFVRYKKIKFLSREFDPMITLTFSKKNKTRNMVDAARGALLTLEEIRETDKQRRQQRLAEKSGKDTDRKRFLRRAFSSPDRESREHEMKKAKTELQQRNKIMQDIKDGLLDFHDHPKVVKALHLCLDSRVGIMEARNRDYNIGTTVHRIAEVRSLGPIVTTLAKKLIDAWHGEYTVPEPCFC